MTQSRGFNGFFCEAHHTLADGAARLGDLDFEVTMEGDASGWNILWGEAPDKLYHSYLTYQKTQRVGALIQGRRYYVRVDAFNENGITEGVCRPLD